MKTEKKESRRTLKLTDRHKKLIEHFYKQKLFDNLTFSQVTLGIRIFHIPHSDPTVIFKETKQLCTFCCEWVVERQTAEQNIH